MNEKRTIWKFGLEGHDPVLAMPAGAEVVSFDLQDGQATLWAMVDPAAPRVQRRFHVVGTGWVFESPVTYRGMVQMPNGLVWHLLEDVAPVSPQGVKQ
jgi:hypothetical protein